MNLSIFNSARFTSISIVILAVSISCYSLNNDDQELPEAIVIGYIQDLEASSLTQIKRIQLKDLAGEISDFDGSEFSGVLPSHLRQHLILGTPIEIRYFQLNDKKKILEIRDHIKGSSSLPHQ